MQPTAIHSTRSHAFRPRLITGCAALLLSAAAASAQFTISTAPGLFTPSFRDPLNTDAGNTTFFGWIGANAAPNFGFDGVTNNELIDLPPALQGVGGLTGTLLQVSTDDILSSGNNIYTAANVDQYLTLQIPTNGTPGTGFTTIIIQAKTAFGGFPTNTIADFDFNTLGGDSVDFVVGTNAASPSPGAQFWAKYEIIGNAATYNLNLGLLPNNVSIGELLVDTQWSASGFSSDFAQAVPEPSAALSLLTGSALLGLARRRRAPGSAT